MLCGLAQTLPQIVLARLLQGLCGAALVPLSQAVLLDINPPERQPRAMSVWAMATSLGPIMGPALGGWLTENYNWRWVFFINVPFGILAFLGMLSFMPETAIRKSRFDFIGFTALSVGIGAFQLLLDRGQIKDWFSSTEIWIEATVAFVALYLFLVHMLTTTQQRFVNPLLFKDRNFITGNLFIFVIGVVMFATLALLPPMLQDLMNYPVLTTGLVTAPRGVGSLAAMFLAPRLLGKADPRLIIGSGFALTAFSAWQMTGFDLTLTNSGGCCAPTARSSTGCMRRATRRRRSWDAVIPERARASPRRSSLAISPPIMRRDRRAKHRSGERHEPRAHTFARHADRAVPQDGPHQAKR